MIEVEYIREEVILREEEYSWIKRYQLSFFNSELWPVHTIVMIMFELNTIRCQVGNYPIQKELAIIERDSL